MYTNRDSGIYINDLVEQCRRSCALARKEIKHATVDDDYLYLDMANGNLIVYDMLDKSFRWFDCYDSYKTYLEDDSDETWIKRFAIKLNRKIARSGMSQDDVAWRAGISGGSLSKYLNRESVPGVRNLQKICDVLDCTVNDLIY